MKKPVLLLLCIVASVALLFAQEGKKSLSIYHLTDRFYVYTTYGLADNEPYPANSMYLVTDSGVVMFDTPWDTTQFQPLLDSIEARHHKKVVMCVVTHFHADRTAGMGFLKSKGIPTYAYKLTYDLCTGQPNRQAQFFFVHDTVFNIGNYRLQTYYGGAGHTKDNIVVWCPQYKVLYGGCLVKSTEAPGLGNIADADLKAWPQTMKNLIKKFKNARYVIPGHLSWKNKNALAHTLKLANNYCNAHP